MEKKGLFLKIIIFIIFIGLFVVSLIKIINFNILISTEETKIIFNESNALMINCNIFNIFAWVILSLGFLLGLAVFILQFIKNNIVKDIKQILTVFLYALIIINLVTIIIISFIPKNFVDMLSYSLNGTDLYLSAKVLFYGLLFELFIFLILFLIMGIAGVKLGNENKITVEEKQQQINNEQNDINNKIKQLEDELQKQEMQKKYENLLKKLNKLKSEDKEK